MNNFHQLQTDNLFTYDVGYPERRLKKNLSITLLYTVNILRNNKCMSFGDKSDEWPTMDRSSSMRRKLKFEASLWCNG